MLCPRCRDVDMFVLEFEQVEVDYIRLSAGTAHSWVAPVAERTANNVWGYNLRGLQTWAQGGRTLLDSFYF